jgi:hypothetical protein
VAKMPSGGRQGREGGGRYTHRSPHQPGTPMWCACGRSGDRTYSEIHAPKECETGIPHKLNHQDHRRGRSQYSVDDNGHQYRTNPQSTPQQTTPSRRSTRLDTPTSSPRARSKRSSSLGSGLDHRRRQGGGGGGGGRGAGGQRKEHENDLEVRLKLHKGCSAGAQGR